MRIYASIQIRLEPLMFQPRQLPLIFISLINMIFQITLCMLRIVVVILYLTPCR